MTETIVTDVGRLKVACSPVDSRHDWRALASRLRDAMAQFGAQGLAANQIWVQLQACVIVREKGTPLVMFNPRMFPGKEVVESNERCLSLPGVVVRVPRSEKVRVDCLNEWGKPVRHRLEGIEARRAQHEIDHLWGRLITAYEVNYGKS